MLPVTTSLWKNSSLPSVISILVFLSLLSLSLVTVSLNGSGGTKRNLQDFHSHLYNLGLPASDFISEKKKKEVGGSVFLRLRLQKINVKWNKRPSFSVDDLKSLSDTGDNALTADVSNSCCREIRIFAFKKCTFKILISRLMVTLLH